MSFLQVIIKLPGYENTGNKNFHAHTITTNAEAATSVYAIDVDGDEDIDVLSASFTDHKIAWYENLGIITEIYHDRAKTPTKPVLYRNYPNPFNPETSIVFDVPQYLPVVLKIYDIQGQETAILIDEHLAPGQYKAIFNAQNLVSGVYIYHIKIGIFQTANKMILVR